MIMTEVEDLVEDVVEVEVVNLDGGGQNTDGKALAPGLVPCCAGKNHREFAPRPETSPPAPVPDTTN